MSGHISKIRQHPNTTNGPTMSKYYSSQKRENLRLKILEAEKKLKRMQKGRNPSGILFWSERLSDLSTQYVGCPWCARESGHSQFCTRVK